MNPLMVKPGNSIGYGFTREEVHALPYDEALRMVEFLGEAWEKERDEIESAKRKR